MMTSRRIEEDLKLQTRDKNSRLLREYTKREVELLYRLLYNQRSRPLVVRRENARLRHFRFGLTCKTRRLLPDPHMDIKFW